MTGNSRFAAFELLKRFRKNSSWTGYSSKITGDCGLDRRDAALAENIFIGTVRNLYYLDYYISVYSDIRLESINPDVLDILREALFQILFLDRVPDSAAVNEAVSLCRAVYPKASGFVNAVLRRLCENKNALPEIESSDLSSRFSVEPWICDRLTEQFGFEGAENFLRCSNLIPELSVRVNILKCSFDEYCKLLSDLDIEYSVPDFPDNCVLIKDAAFYELPGFDEGFFYVQDRAAAMCTEAAKVIPGYKILDVCAAPGGKTISAALSMKNEGSIISCDIHENKLHLISSSCERLAINIVSCLKADGRVYNPEFDSVFDTVITDVPCSGLGVIRKKPEIKYKKQDEVGRLPDIQYNILSNASRYVRPGGCLIYSTCTVLHSENEEVVKSFLENHPDFKAENFSIYGIDSRDGMYTFLPQINNTDGFFITRLVRSNL